MLLRLCSGRFYIFTEQMWFKPQVSHWEVMTHISIYCSYCFCSAGFALWYKRIFFDLFWSVKLFYYSWIIAWVSGLPKGLGERRFLMGELSPFFPSIFPLSPQKCMILRLAFPVILFDPPTVLFTHLTDTCEYFSQCLFFVSIKFWHKVIVLFFKFWS